MLKTFKCLSIWIPLWNSFCRPILCSLQSLNVLLLMLGAVIARMWWLDAKVSTGFCNLSLTYIDVWNVNIHRDIRSTLKIKANWIYTKCTHPHPNHPSSLRLNPWQIERIGKRSTGMYERESIYIYIYWHMINDIVKMYQGILCESDIISDYIPLSICYIEAFERERERGSEQQKKVSAKQMANWNGMDWNERKGKERNPIESDSGTCFSIQMA